MIREIIMFPKINIVEKEEITYTINWIEIRRKLRQFIYDVYYELKKLIKIKIKEKINKLWINYCNFWNKYVNKEGKNV